MSGNAYVMQDNGSRESFVALQLINGTEDLLHVLRLVARLALEELHHNIPSGVLFETVQAYQQHYNEAHKGA